METMSNISAIDLNQSSVKLAREMIDRIADKWTLLVISTLGECDNLRFTQLRNRIEGVSQKMLTQTLRQLERDGLIFRHVYAVVPPKVEYTLTELGHSLLSSVSQICSWVDQNLQQIEDARQAFEARRNDEGLT